MLIEVINSAYLKLITQLNTHLYAALKMYEKLKTSVVLNSNF